MATRKTILSIEVTKDEYQIQYSGGLKPDWDHMDKSQRRAVLRHDSRLCSALLACPEAFQRIAGFVHTIERYQRREAKRARENERKKVSEVHEEKIGDTI